MQPHIIHSISFIGDDSQLFQVRASQYVHEYSTRYYPRCSQFRHITTDDIPDMIDHIIGFKKSLDQAIQIQDVMLSNEASVEGFQVTVIFAKCEMQHDQQL